MAKAFWFCVIEVEVEDGKRIPDGGDNPPRVAAENAIEQFEGCEVRVNSSGWGLSQKGAEALKHAACLSENSVSGN